MSANADVAIVGGGIIGCALAAFLAEDGARVRLYEREEIAAGASGRNSGLLQHPMDEALTDIFAASEALYAELGHGFELPPEVVGVLVVGEDAAALEPIRAEIAGHFPELAAEALDAPHELEPALAEDLAAFRLDTGRPVPPAAATRAFAARAREAGAEIREGVAATPVVEGGRAVGVRTPQGRGARRRGRRRRRPVERRARRPHRRLAAGRAVVGRQRRAPPQPPAAPLDRGDRHREPEDLGRRRRPAVQHRHPRRRLRPRLDVPARAAGPRRARARPARARHALHPPAGRHPRRLGPRLRAPASPDGRPLLGPLATQGLFLATGHGPWGVSLGPGSARLVADAVLGKPAEIPPELAATRF